MKIEINDCYKNENHIISIKQRPEIPIKICDMRSPEEKRKDILERGEMWERGAKKLYNFFSNEVCSGFFEAIQILFIEEALEWGHYKSYIDKLKVILLKYISVEELEMELKKRVVEKC